MVLLLATGLADISPWTGLLSNRNETSGALTAVTGWTCFFERKTRDEPIQTLFEVLHRSYPHHLEFLWSRGRGSCDCRLSVDRYRPR